MIQKFHSWVFIRRKENTNLKRYMQPYVQTFVSKVMFLLFNTLSKLVITFLPRTKRLLILWLQTPSAVILEPKERKSVTASTFPPYICHEVMGSDATTSVFECWVLSQPFYSPLSPSSRGSLVPLHQHRYERDLNTIINHFHLRDIYTPTKIIRIHTVQVHQNSHQERPHSES